MLLAGITIMIVGHTRAVASVEHNIGHFIEMKTLEKFGKTPYHGATVGVATLMVYPLFKRFAEEDLSGLDVGALTPMDPEARRAFMLESYGDVAANTIMSENPGDFLSTEELRRRAQRAKERFADIKAVIDGMPAYEDVAKAMRELGAPMTMAELGVDAEMEKVSMHCAKDYRTRYTLFKTLDEVGLLQKYLTEAGY